ncbi:uncharacterized protein LY89DRAFT_603906 [Mollisia scopiformis]|uniref:Zn(2)-C6 fungal-type domain-containing protein n=1 Tax=Mollisia scopiformis TaxID=149040 RepID=A0A194XU33_MOLSC|nr:uncharacterized protein LY89DRAFT_603906 [Mollisia scopiformis]KUJ23718.1 hypothetical protein LY89DRAFT_603906 [Mollisia scopiformis]
MVNTGKPSQGCGTCRARRIKCDERKPTCFRCQKSKRECTGYRDTAFVRMRWDRNSRSSSKKLPSPTSSTADNRDLVRRTFSSAHSSDFTTSPTSPLRFHISVSPFSGLETPIEEQVKCIFRRNFVLEPCEGNSRSFMKFTVPVLEHEKSLSGKGKGSKLGTAVMAAGLALMGNRPASRHLMPKAMKCYSRALKEINEALLVEKEAVEDDTLAAVIVLGLFEVLTGTSGQPSGWISHADGAAILVKMRDEKKAPLTDLGRVLHIMARSQLVVNCLVSCSPPIPGVTWWMRFGTKDNLPAICARLNLEVATLHAKCNSVLTSASKTLTSDLESVLEVLKLAKALDAEFKEWEASLPRSWRYGIVAWIDEDECDDADLEDMKAFPGRTDEYVDISIATAFNMMRASRMMLCGDIVRASAWLCPTYQDYRTMPEFGAAVRTSKDLIEDILASVPYFLGGGPGNPPLAERPQSGKASLVGTAALGLFITWPLMVCKMSDYATERQRKWAEGRLRFIANDLWIGQARLFSKINAKLPSMFIARDEFTQVDGVKMAKQKCMELAMAASPYVKGAEMEAMIAGLLGCK